MNSALALTEALICSQPFRLSLSKPIAVRRLPFDKLRGTDVINEMKSATP